MEIFFVIVNATTKLPEQFPNISGFGQMVYCNDFASFPVTGATSILNYVDLAEGNFYKWNGSTYIIDENPRLLEWINDMMNGGMGPNQELIASWEPSARPDMSTFLYEVGELRQYKNIAHPIYPMLKQWEITYPYTDTTKEFRLEALDNKESEANESTMPSQKRLKNLILAFDNALKALGYDKYTTLINEKKKKEIKLVQNIADKIRANKATKDLKVAAVNNNQNPDIDSDWLYDAYDDNEANIMI
jgi:hypothetical protein